MQKTKVDLLGVSQRKSLGPKAKILISRTHPIYAYLLWGVKAKNLSVAICDVYVKASVSEISFQKKST